LRLAAAYIGLSESELAATILVDLFQAGSHMASQDLIEKLYMAWQAEDVFAITFEPDVPVHAITSTQTRSSQWGILRDGYVAAA